MKQFPCISPHFTPILHTTHSTHFKPYNSLFSLFTPVDLHDQFPDIMSTPYTLMRCRIKDLISCFNACKLPVDKDDDESDNQNPNTSSINNNRNIEREKKVKVETTSESCQSCQSEEDEYIVFYFKDDEAGGDVIEERGLDAKCFNSRNKVTSQESPSNIQVDAIKESKPGPGQHRYTCSESSESSTGSFAFPVIQREWAGSPVLMPRPEAHNKSCGVCIQCCKF